MVKVRWLFTSSIEQRYHGSFVVRERILESLRNLEFSFINYWDVWAAYNKANSDLGHDMWEVGRNCHGVPTRKNTSLFRQYMYEAHREHSCPMRLMLNVANPPFLIFNTSYHYNFVLDKRQFVWVVRLAVIDRSNAFRSRACRAGRPWQRWRGIFVRQWVLFG